MSTTREQIIEGAVPPLVASSWKMAAGGYCVWEYEDETWTVKKESCALGYHPGDAPQEKGRFEGEVLRKHCEPVLDPVPEPATADH
jgi:hypothetical protein